MKNYPLSIACFVTVLLSAFISKAQTPMLTTVAGNGTSGFSGDGGAATAAKIGQALGACGDAMGNIYIADDDNHRIRKVNPAGIITTIAGGGGSTASGIPATAASLSLDVAGTMSLDAYGNLFIVDGQRIRRIDGATGIITTVVGIGSAGFSGDGGPATAAQINYPAGICFDAAGNMYIGDQNNRCVRKVSTAGNISTIAGTGASGFSGDGGPATAANVDSPDGLCVDAVGNIYVADRYNYRIRRITPSGIISTYAGSGSSGSGGDGGPATAADFSEPSHVCMDNYGNLYIADFHNSRIRKVTPSGTISTFAGGGSSTASGVPATSASFSDTWGVAIDGNDNIYISDRHHYRICRVDGLGIPSVTADSFFVAITQTCSGMNFRVVCNSWSSAQHVKTYFGNGTTLDTATFLFGTHGIVNTYRGYLTGVHTVKHVLYNGTVAIDSITYTRTFTTCQNFGVQFYYDANSNCAKDAGETDILTPRSIEVDSAGVPIDTVSATSGFYYTAYGPAGTVYRFNVLTDPADLVACGGGSVYDTLSVVGGSNVRHLGFSCTSTPGFDLKVFSSFRAGTHHFGGAVVVNNTYCTPQSGTVTMNLSPTYNTSLSFSPTPTSVVGNLVTWNIAALSSIIGVPVVIHADMEKAVGATPAYGDTVNTHYAITPIAGDGHPTDNDDVRTDTVRSGYDPNDISVTPSGCIEPGAHTLRYTIHFENTGNDTAFNIYVLDTLPATVNPKSVKILAASAKMYSSVISSAGHNIIKFDFPDINLLDSSHHGFCDGMVVFTVDIKGSLPSRTAIPARAGIYFDYNPVVLTNTATVVVDCNGTASSVPVEKGSGIDIYPNPSAGDFILLADDAVFRDFRIMNSVGQVVMRQNISAARTKVDISQLPSGVYVILLRGDNGGLVRKIIKM